AAGHEPTSGAEPTQEIRAGRMRRHRRAAVMVPLLAVLVFAGRTDAAAQTAATLQCERCHGERELLRQHVETAAEAQRLEVPAGMVRSSAHGGLECAACHSGFARF